LTIQSREKQTYGLLSNNRAFKCYSSLSFFSPSGVFNDDESLSTTTLVELAVSQRSRLINVSIAAPTLAPGLYPPTSLTPLYDLHHVHLHYSLPTPDADDKHHSTFLLLNPSQGEVRLPDYLV